MSHDNGPPTLPVAASEVDDNIDSFLAANQGAKVFHLPGRGRFYLVAATSVGGKPSFRVMVLATKQEHGEVGRTFQGDRLNFSADGQGVKIFQLTAGGKNVLGPEILGEAFLA